ncbi:hypothetical protein F5Y07DRAFT_231830 [Xylaria sp. FL0933]|nr:hypothetical protein F5Y07DRAFT_231830 [Xylaria sp. FL0933]
MASRTVLGDQSSSLLNKRYDEDYSFPQFVLLPWELRNQVWRCALQKRRFLRVWLSATQPDGVPEQALSDIKYGRSFVSVNGSQLLSKLLRVNSEARKAALEFYRVRLPSMLKMWRPDLEDARRQIGIFPFNPEYDVLWFQQAAHLPEFLRAIYMHDSRRVGLCNMAIGLEARQGTPGPASFDDPAIYQCPTFIQAVNNIREFYLVVETSSYETESIKQHIRYQPFADGISLAQSFVPLMSTVPSFDLLRRDPRSIKRSLTSLFLGNTEIPFLVSCWKLRLDEWGVDYTQVKSRILCVYRHQNPCLPPEDWSNETPGRQRSRVPGTDQLLHESSSSLAPTIHLSVERQPPTTGHCPAFGFWLFPFDAFTEENREALPSPSLRLWDLSDYWPELALIHLPTGPSSDGYDKSGIPEVTMEEAQLTA